MASLLLQLLLGDFWLNQIYFRLVEPYFGCNDDRKIDD